MAEFEPTSGTESYAEVEPLLTAYVDERPISSWGWYALGYSRFGQQKIGEAIQALAKSLEIDIRNAEAHKILGRSLMVIGRFDAAQLEFEQGIRYKPDSAEMHYNLGKLLSIQDNWEPARKAFEAALQHRSFSMSKRWMRSASRWRRLAMIQARSPTTRKRSRSMKSGRAHSPAPT